METFSSYLAWLTVVKFKIYGFFGLKTWLLVVTLFLPSGTIIQDRYWVYDLGDCNTTGRPAAEALWKQHDSRGDVAFLCIDQKFDIGI